MIGRDREAEILRLHHAEKWRVGTIATQLGLHHSTVRRVLAQAGLDAGRVSVRPSIADPYVPFIEETLKQYPRLRASRLFEMVKGRLMDVILMGVMMFGITLVWSLLMIPVFLAIFLVSAVVAGLPALLVGGIAGLFAQGATPWIIAAIVAVPIFLVVVIIPGTLVGGWQQIFTSSTWTLTYRETLALEKTNGKSEPSAPETPETPAAPAAA